jgi:type I restriction enzyme M protein
MTAQVSKQEICDVVWRACDTFRGTIDPSQYKDYILVMLFLKYISDLWKEKKEQYEARYRGEAGRVERALSRERFRVPKDCDFDNLYARRDAANVGELINIALEGIEDANKEKLENVFRNIDFNSEPHLGQTRDRNRLLKQLLEDFADPRLDLRPSRIGDKDIIGDVYEYLIGRFASDAGKKAGEFYTPPEVAILLARLLRPRPGSRICDPACGSGSLLIRVAKQVGSNDFSLFGQELNGSTWALCRMNMFVHEMDGARIEWCNTITSPRLVEDDRLLKFDIVVANPPFSLDKWGVEVAEHDKYHRFHRGVPPKSRGDYAFISHMIEAAIEGEGRVGVVVPHGVLFRAGSEGKIRQKLIEENLLDAVVGLPANLFYGTTIPAALLIFDKGKKDASILFIDASEGYEDGKNQNRLRGKDIDRVIAAFAERKSEKGYSHLAAPEEVRGNDFNLNIPRYISKHREEEEVDVAAVQREIERLEAELADTRRQIAVHLKELGLGGEQVGRR